MDEQEAKDRCAELARDHPERETHQWVPVHSKDGTWSVAKINLPPTVKPTGTQTQANHPDPNDPRHLPPWLNPPGGGIA